MRKYCLLRKMLCLLLLLLTNYVTIKAQVSGVTQPKIMVVPKLKEGQQYREVYDKSDNLRIAIAKINETMLKEGANIVSFDAKYRELKQNIELNRIAGNIVDEKAMILEKSGADIYVEAEVNVVRHEQLSANSVSVILEAYQAGTGNYLGVKEGRSRMNETEDIGLLTSLAMDGIATSFLNLVQLKFNDIHANGQSIFVQFTISKDADFDFDTEKGAAGKMLSELIDDWFQQHTVKGVFNNQGVVASMMIISDARIPLKDPANLNSNYTGQHFFRDINKFFKSLNIKAKREIGNNNKIIITLTN
jgi:Family of unknown function (DUF6175)